MRCQDRDESKRGNTAIGVCVAVCPENHHEEDDEQEKLQQKDLQIQQLRDRNRVDKNTIQSVRSQMKTLRAHKPRDDASRKK